MRCQNFFRKSVFILAAFCLVALYFAQMPARERATPLITDGVRDPLGILVLDGSGVHDAGQLLMHTGNWGAFGSYPASNTPISQYPSAEWPAGSGIEHLNIAGLWVGGLKGCNQGAQELSVSTGAYEMEFRPTADPIDRIYETSEGAPGGNRLPSPFADDDSDGLIDEDPLDGRDNDGDGLVDEDFAAISQQMFSSWYTDDQPEAIAQYPEHEPMHIMVRQESYQWTDPRFDDFVGVSFTLSNIGTDCLAPLYLGLMLDFDIGKKDDGQYWMDDAAGFWKGIRCTELGPALVSMAYMCDMKDGVPSSYMGAMILGHPIDPSGTGLFPERVGANSFHVFRGDQPYEDGGDPVNDYQRYEAMSSRTFDRNANVPNDYRVLMSVGPFGLSADDPYPLEFHVGFVCGASLEELLDNAARCQKLFDGLRFDVDGDPMTGVDRRETPVPGPVSGVIIDACRSELSDPVSWPRNVTRWINYDCEWENELKEECGYDESDSLLFRTGVAGRETHVNWIYEREEAPKAYLDIKPGSCPNPFNVNIFEVFADGNPHKGGVLPVAILGSDGFDVRDIDLETVRLERVEPLAKGCAYEDVSTPVYGWEQCDCSTAGPDGYEDLVLKFNKQRIAAALLNYGLPKPGQEAVLVMRGNLKDGTPFEAADCILFVGPRPDVDTGNREMLTVERTRLLAATPNPFNPATTIRFDLAAPGHVTLAVYDVGGRLVRILVDRPMGAGMYEATWDGRSAAGSASASGVYFYRLTAPGFDETRKMVLLR